MTGETHKAGGVLCSVAGFLLLKNNNLLLGNVNELIQLGIMYPFCVWASTASDLDHHWDSCPSKDIPSYFINKALHLTTPVYKRLDNSLTASEKKSNPTYKATKLLSANHRSWQTHSDLTMVIMFMVLVKVLSGSLVGKITPVDNVILSLIVMGMSMGFIAHCVLDMLTPEGVWCVLFVGINKLLKRKLLPEKLRFVPKWGCFATSSDWERFVLLIIKVLTVVVVIVLILGWVNPSFRLSDLFPYSISFN